MVSCSRGVEINDFPLCNAHSCTAIEPWLELACTATYSGSRYPFAHTNEHAEAPFIAIGAAASVFYFAWYVVLVPVVGIVENTLADLDA